MLGKSKTFGSGIPQGVPPVVMTLNDQQFRVRGSMSGLRLLNLIKAMDGSGESDSATEMVAFVEQAVLAEDRERFMAYLLDAEPPVPLSQITEIITWLIGEYSGRPTVQPEPSTAGSTPTGSGSTDGLVSPESTSQTQAWMPPPSYQSASPS